LADYIIDMHEYEVFLITDINMPGSFRDQLHVIPLSGREIDSRGYPLIRKPMPRSDLQRVVAETSWPC
jgi:hypothetical protein